MKISRKILKFTKPLTYRRGWRRAQRSIFRVPLGPMLAQIDRERAREIQQRYVNSTAGYAKYANIEPWLRLNRERAQDLNLHRSTPKRVLDLGCGGGFFLFILKNLGHSVLGSMSSVFRCLANCWSCSEFRESFIGLMHSNLCPILVRSSIGSPGFPSILIFIIRRRNAGERRNGIFSCAICKIIWRRAGKSFSDSIPATMVTIIRPKSAIFS